MKKALFVSVVVLVVLVVVTITFYQIKKSSKPVKVAASNSTSVITDESQWNTGTLSNISVDPSGNMSINDKNSIASLVDTTGSTVTATCSSDTKQNAIDNNTGTEWGPNLSMGPACDWTIQLPTQLRLKSFHLDFYAYTGIDVYTSTNGTDWTKQNETTLITFPAHAVYSRDQDLLHESDALYFRINEPNGAPYETGVDVYELRLYGSGPATATHTTGATQISGGDSYWGWQTFTPTYTKPTNTNIQFRFRSSTDGSSWTGWSDAQSPNSGSSLDISALVTNRTGSTDNPTYYKYLQIETTLSSTDGVSTPTLDDYSISYHTNVSPSKPTGLTAVIGG